MRHFIQAAIAATVLATAAGAQLPITMQHSRPLDQRGLNVFESPKDDTITFTQPRLNLGVAFRQDFQGLQHSNTAAPKMVALVDQNALINMGHGFNNASANLYLDVQLARGIRVAMTSYLSARHHNETWVKDGYVLIDDSPIKSALLESIMSFATLKVGHFEINYGDGHFRRTDNGSAMFNPFIGNYILDAFTTEVGAEGYLKIGAITAMAGMTNGEVKGMILSPEKRSPAYYAKAGFDRQMSPALRVRVMGSMITQASSANQTLYGGDRGGSPYYDVMENTSSTETANAWSGEIRNPFLSKIKGAVFNPFVKYNGLEFFGQFEIAKGNNGGLEVTDRKIAQQVYEGLYRMDHDQFYVGGRYINFDGRLAGFTQDANISRYQVGGGWFVTKNLLTKLEWVNQKYNDFPSSDIRNGGNFKGFMISGAVGF
ncbi:MAG: hypothetical protein JWO05_2209 [Gemmatimonadetes bacterium]|nr:hypothetical protein [Gemmatimonadota bacterium]